jgi:hypothetical protein
MSHVSKCGSETKPNHWLEDYWLRMRAGEVDNDFMVQYLHLPLSSSARAWLNQFDMGCVTNGSTFA